MESSNKPHPNQGTPSSGGRPVHGGIKPAELRALGLEPGDVRDFSASVSPIGPPPGIWEAMRQVDLSAYPDPHCLELREALSQHLANPAGVPLDCLLVGNGSTEIIHLLSRIYLSPEKGAFLFSPTYGEYEGACRLAGAPVFRFDADLENGFLWDLDRAASLISKERPGLVFMCNPNNPTGVFLQQAEVESLAQTTQRAGGVLVVDEAYLSFVEGAWGSLELIDRYNAVVVRSMTKDYALTGLRLGYSVAGEEITRGLATYQPDWSVNAFAQQAGLAALADDGYLPRAREAVVQAKTYLTESLSGLGFKVHPSAANFLLIDVGDAAAWRGKLLSRGLVVRDCASFGLSTHIRLGIRSMPDCQRLVEAVTNMV